MVARILIGEMGQREGHSFLDSSFLRVATGGRQPHSAAASPRGSGLLVLESARKRDAHSQEHIISFYGYMNKSKLEYVTIYENSSLVMWPQPPPPSMNPAYGYLPYPYFPRAKDTGEVQAFVSRALQVSNALLGNAKMSLPKPEQKLTYKLQAPSLTE